MSISNRLWAGRATAREYLRVALLLLLLALVAQLLHIVFQRDRAVHDFYVHHNRAVEFTRAMAAGEWWPRWMEAFKYGLGDPAMLYYAPLYYTLVGIVRPLTATTWDAMMVVDTASIFARGLLTWMLVRACVGPRWALPAAAMAVLSPTAIMLYDASDAFSGAAAVALVSWFFWAMLRPLAHGRLINLHAVVALALAIGTHTVTGIMCMMAIAPLVLIGFGGRLRIERAW